MHESAHGGRGWPWCDIPAPAPPDKHPIASVHRRQNSTLRTARPMEALRQSHLKARLAGARNRNVVHGRCTRQTRDGHVRHGRRHGEPRCLSPLSMPCDGGTPRLGAYSGRWAAMVWNLRALEPRMARGACARVGCLEATLSSMRHSISGDGGAVGRELLRRSASRKQPSACDARC
jgi:hypothetical protein